MATTAQNVLQNVLYILNEPTLTLADLTKGNFWTGNELISYLQEGLRVLAKRSRFWRTMGSITLTSGTATYTLPTDCIEPISLLLGTWRMERRSVSWLDENYPTWPTITGRPFIYCRDVVGVSEILFYPNPDDATVSAYPTVSLRYVKMPTIPAALTDTIDLPDHYAIGLLYYVLFRCYQKEGELQNVQKSQLNEQMFEGIVGAMTTDASAGFERSRIQTTGYYY